MEGGERRGRDGGGGGGVPDKALCDVGEGFTQTRVGTTDGNGVGQVLQHQGLNVCMRVW